MKNAFSGSVKRSKEPIISKRTNKVWIIAFITVLVVAGTLLVNAAAQKAAVPKPQDKLAIGENEVKQLLLLMDTDKKGMVSKQEFMNFMQAEFDRLDKDKTGQLNVKAITQSNMSASRFVGK
jgi:hypothetical protein